MPNGFTGRSRSSYSRFKIVVAVIGGLVICHLLSVVITSAQSTAAGGPLILFPLALLWQEDKNQGLSTLIDPTYLQVYLRPMQWLIESIKHCTGKLSAPSYYQGSAPICTFSLDRSKTTGILGMGSSQC